ncbi:MAG: transcription-repair coupling factor [Phycisphaerae bacterium]
MAALAAQQLKCPLLLICAHADEAEESRDDIETVIGRPPELLPQLESLPGETEEADDLAAERLRLCLAVGRLKGAQTSAPPAADASVADSSLIVAPIHALMQPVPTPDAVRAQSCTVATGQTLDAEKLVAWLIEHGFQRCDQVELPGDFATRGGILDVFGRGAGDPARIELFGDQVESIRLFDAGTQRSSNMLGEIQIPAMRLSAASSETTSFLALLPPTAIIAIREPAEVQELGRTYWQRLGERAGVIRVEAIFRRANDFAQIYLQRFAGGDAQAIRFDTGALPPFEPVAGEALRSLHELARESQVVVLCDNEAERQRFGELLAEQKTLAVPPEAESSGGNRVPDGLPAAGDQPLTDLPALASRATHATDSAHSNTPTPAIETIVGVLHRGFRWGGVAYVPHHEIFRRTRQRRTLRRVAPARPIDSFFDLSAGDHVVHVMHGIGRFQGLRTMERGERREEYLAIEFADKAVVHVPTSQIHVVQKYVGSVRGKPQLSKLGGQAWKRTKERVADAVTDMAAELLAIQAQRSTREGIAYPQDTLWQREFEGAFLYTETEDQLRALGEIKGDMTRPRPMDRLICGDVGFGKTELAMRAAFKTVEYGKQVAVLVPTTVLAEQHHQTFRERLADYPFSVEVLSRFRTKGEQGKIVEQARKGQIDVLIGTHRLLSADVKFADLGLVVIDEEQRFGVDAKERLKRMRATVDVLTLSATPIPRTLHMAMLGIRDISSLATPPVDRRSIITQVRMWEDRLIREAIVRELSRDGQVYFVHNFVRDIEQIANQIRALVPDARVVVGHGQMGGAELEEVMLAFLRKEAHVLVSTNIIESGLDIPSANTIFINRAERFGLADLHQLRGRVGRSRHRAYAYLLLSPKHPVQETAARRLKAIEQYSELGAGFQIAMRDLEIRGAGNILGPEQSGHIEAVGYEMYCQLLEQAARRLRNEPPDEWRPVNLDLGISASIPRAYIRSDRQRMEVYKRLAAARKPIDVRSLSDDLRDAFGAPPEEVRTLLQMAEIRVLAAPFGVRSIVLTTPDVVFSIDDLQRAQPLFSHGPGSPRMPDPRTVHWRLPPRLLETAKLLDVLVTQLSHVSK